VGLVGLAWIALGAIGAAQPARCAPTRPDMLGPFYTPNAPERGQTGRGLVMAGHVRSADCAPLPGARIEWWSANAKGDYDDEHRATQIADAQGRYRYETDLPGRYPGRPPHVHVRVSAPGHRVLVTQLYPGAPTKTIETDFILIQD
jgi:protocatechuate 3,4-dioxygenase beta subunit